MIKLLKKLLFKSYFKLTDPRRLVELSGTRILLDSLKAQGKLAGLANKRILEIGPKHGQDSEILASLNPAELVLIDLPEKRELVSKWLSKIPGNVRYIEGNILYLTREELSSLGKFDFILCAGVLYHNAEQLRLLKKLYELSSLNGKVVIESATTRNPILSNLNVIEVCWPNTYRNVPTVTHLPSRLAIKSWLEMAGFENVIIEDIYSRDTSKQRVIISCQKMSEDVGYTGYSKTFNQRTYSVGNAN